MGRAAVSTRLGWIKLSLLPLSKRALTCHPLTFTVADDFKRDPGALAEAVASVGDQGAAETPVLGVDDFPLQTFAKWPFF